MKSQSSSIDWQQVIYAILFSFGAGLIVAQRFEFAATWVAFIFIFVGIIGFLLSSYLNPS